MHLFLCRHGSDLYVYLITIIHEIVTGVLTDFGISAVNRTDFFLSILLKLTNTV